MHKFFRTWIYSNGVIYSCNPNIKTCVLFWLKKHLPVLDIWTFGSQLVWGGLGEAVLIEEVRHWDLKALPTSFALSAQGYRWGCGLSAPVPATMPAMPLHHDAFAFWKHKRKQALLRCSPPRSHRSCRKGWRATGPPHSTGLLRLFLSLPQ